MLEFLVTELKVAVQLLRSCYKAPAPAGITSWVWSVVYYSRPLMPNAVFNTCLRTRVFPGGWKHACLALIQKLGKPKRIPSSYS